MRVELRDIRSGAGAGVAEIKGDLQCCVVARACVRELQVLVAELGVAQPMPRASEPEVIVHGDGYLLL